MHVDLDFFDVGVISAIPSRIPVDLSSSPKRTTCCRLCQQPRIGLSRRKELPYGRCDCFQESGMAKTGPRWRDQTKHSSDLSPPNVSGMAHPRSWRSIACPSLGIHRYTRAREATVRSCQHGKGKQLAVITPPQTLESCSNVIRAHSKHFWVKHGSLTLEVLKSPHKQHQIHPSGTEILCDSV
jgi:hypothetical protein